MGMITKEIILWRIRNGDEENLFYSLSHQVKTIPVFYMNQDITLNLNKIINPLIYISLNEANKALYNQNPVYGYSFHHPKDK